MRANRPGRPVAIHRFWTQDRGAILAVLLAGAACAPRPAMRVPSLSEVKLGEAGLQFYPSPRTYDGPGTVFRIVDGEMQRVAVLSSLVRTDTAAEYIPSSRVSGSVNLRLLAGWVGADSASYSPARTDSVIIEIGGSRRELTSEATLATAVDSARKIVDWTNRSPVYMVVESVLADTIHIEIVSSSHDTARISMSPARAGFASASIQRGSSGRISVSARFPSPHRVLFKVRRLVPSGLHLEEGAGGRVLMVPVGGTLTWSKER